ncbi:hypothetical protein HZ993_05275 [Rhodoferax sp. AJA081-3]|uniref:hypothetical protein n=1 Tax=Rhodoferax sp. AJA081-3 TaxID=2752316 RepID=UPI001AE08503|nr:hypothetical protein [Rhodoferax sp. AJA081-3]QTN29243.1 hypothetical protein HZ993_05275 [Rhodoferax sp. AJA081-3]
MRSLIALVFCFLLAPLQVHACLGLFANQFIFFEAIPNVQAEGDVIAKVLLSGVHEETKTAAVTATATVMQVLKTSDARVQQGAKIIVRYKFTSCGPNHRDGDEGTIIARTGTDSKGLFVLYPYAYRRYGDRRIFPPEL